MNEVGVEPRASESSPEIKSVLSMRITGREMERKNLLEGMRFDGPRSRLRYGVLGVLTGVSDGVKSMADVRLLTITFIYRKHFYCSICANALSEII